MPPKAKLQDRKSVPLRLLMDGPEDSKTVYLFAHGAGVPMDAPFMNDFAQGLAERECCRVARFEFPYMAQTRRDGRRRPPNKPEVLAARFGSAIQSLNKQFDKVVIGGKSMGGRIASMIADTANERGNSVAGVVCLGYPFSGGKESSAPRAQHLENIKTPILIVQGTRDSMGDEEFVKKLDFSDAVQIHWVKDGDHHLAPLKSSDQSVEEAREEALDAIAAFIKGLPDQKK